MDQVDIGMVQSAAGLVALAGQMPVGALVDFARSERLVAGLAVAAISVSAPPTRSGRYFRSCSPPRC